LEYSCKEEVEIRSLTILAIEKIKEYMQKGGSKKIKYSYEVDWLLWQMGEM